MELKRVGIIMFKTIAATIFITVLMLLLLTVAVYKWNFREVYIGGGIIFTYFISNFFGGMIIGKIKEKRRFIWGAALGFLYFLVLMILSFIVNNGFGMEGKNVAIAFITCVGAGTLGGMVS